MNKERSKMFALKMKEVFRTKSHHPESNSKIPGNLECGSKLDSKKEHTHSKIKNENFYPRSKFANNCHSSSHILTIPQNPKGYSAADSELCANCIHSPMEELGRSTLGWQLVNNKCPGEFLSDEKRHNGSGSSRSDESPMNENNDCRHLSYLGSSNNRDWSKVVTICDRKMECQQPKLAETNHNLKSDALRGPYSLCRCNLATCRQHCPQGGPICANNNMIVTNNNYLLESFATKRSESSLFSSVLKCAFGGEKTNRNDFIVLALGIHHYVKEVFNALDFNNNGYIQYEDLQILCKILGKDLQNLDKSVSCSNLDVKYANKSNLCGNNSCEVHLHFGKFSELICNTFGHESDSNCFEKRKNTQLVNAVVNITRRNESLNAISKQLEQLENEYLTLASNRDPSQSVKDRYKTWGRGQQNKNYDLPANKYICMENLKLQKIVLLQQQELQCLREVIEDLRVSLQCSDAENLSLRVRETRTNIRGSFESLSDELASRRSLNSADDGRDSIDRLILSFPSTDQLDMDSSESLLSVGSSNRSTPDRQLSPTHRTTPKLQSSKTPTSSETLMSTESSKNWSTPHQHSTFLKSTPQKAAAKKPESLSTFRPTASQRQIEDDLSLEKEIQMVYEKLSVTKMELEETRRDLETSVAEIRTKNSLLDRVTKNMTEAKKLAENSSRENENLKEKMVFIQLDQENKKIKMASLAEELSALRAELASKTEEITLLTQELEHLKIKRQRDFKQLSEARNLIASSLLRAKENEEELKTLLRISGELGTNPNFRFSSPGPKEGIPKGFPFVGKCPQLDNNNNKTQRQPVASKCKNFGHCKENHLNPFNNFISSFSNGCNSTVIKSTNNSDYCHSNKYPRIICFEEAVFGEERNRSNASPYEVRRSEFDKKKRVSAEEQTKCYQPFPAHTGSQREETKIPIETATSTSSFLVSGPDKMLIGPSPFRDKTTMLVSVHSEDKPTMEVKPNLIKPLAITIPLLKESPINDSAVKRLKLGMREELADHEKEVPSAVKMLKQKDGVRVFCSKKDSKIKKCETPKSTYEDSGFQTSTQILEGLEAEVEFMRKSLEDSLLG